MKRVRESYRRPHHEAVINVHKPKNPATCSLSQQEMYSHFLAINRGEQEVAEVEQCKIISETATQHEQDLRRFPESNMEPLHEKLQHTTELAMYHKYNMRERCQKTQRHSE